MKDRGSVGILSLAVLLFMGVLLASLSGYLGAASRLDAANEKAYALRLSLQRAAEEIVAKLSEDSSRESDSPRDAIWSTLGLRDDGIALSLEDASSGLNPNFSSRELLETREIRSLLAPGSSPEGLARMRSEKGLSTEPRHFAGIFAEEALGHLSFFGWANINTADRDSLVSLCLSLTASAAEAEATGAKIDAARSSGRILLPEDLPSFLGKEFGTLSPPICATAPHNSHFASPLLIRAILSMPSLAISDASARADALLAAREDHDLREEELASICGKGAGGRALQYLGLRTWFWRIRAEGSGHAFSEVVAASPGRDADRAKGRRFSGIETRYDP